MKIAIVSPHQGDAAFSLGLTVDHWLVQKHSVHVLNCFTKSTYAPYSDAESLHPNDRASFVSATRKREDVAWNKGTGNKLHLTDFDLLDAPLRLACATEEVTSLDIRAGDRAVARVQGAIAKSARMGFAVAVPLAVGGHIDHRVARQAALQVFAEAPFPLAFYEDLPYAASPGEADQIESLVVATSLDLQPSFASQASKDVAMPVARKQRIAECYDSQIDSEVAGQIASFCQRYGGRERLWVTDAWRAAVGEAGFAGKQIRTA